MKIVYTYRVVCQKLSAPELGPYTTYGILAARDLRGCQQVVQFISDVSLDRALVEALARRCTAAQLDPCHLLDVVEDAIGGKSRPPPKAPTRGEVRPFAGCPIAQGTPLICCSRQAQSLPGCVCRAPFYAATATCLSAPAHTPAYQKSTFVAY